MCASKANCAVCGKELLYFEQAQPVVCAVCGKEETGHSICEDGHYVCDACHRSRGVEFIMDECSKSASSDPIELAQQIMRDKSIYPNGPEHHSLAGAVLLAAYKNSGGDIDLDEALREMRARSLQVPGGACGYWGCCGAATGAGQFFSIVSGSTPMAEEEWGQTARLVSRILGRLADIGGPRCCKRTCFTAIEESVDHVDEVYGIKMRVPERTVCTFMADNARCLGTECPYFPKKEEPAAC